MQEDPKEKKVREEDAVIDREDELAIAKSVSLTRKRTCSSA